MWSASLFIRRPKYILPESAVNPIADKQLTMYEYWYLDIKLYIGRFEIMLT